MLIVFQICFIKPLENQILQWCIQVAYNLVVKKKAITLFYFYIGTYMKSFPKISKYLKSFLAKNATI